LQLADEGRGSFPFVVILAIERVKNVEPAAFFGKRSGVPAFAGMTEVGCA